LARRRMNGRSRIERFSLERSAERVRDFYFQILNTRSSEGMRGRL
jgi:hypothetical protein